ncbi:hypothetical protein BDU57DRAFT_457263 [Ampelomyces quisqualis]|uniref:DUF2264 domain-containing protein n=1 Tax=Ampelomyces quisqualis TaxID=50730 RepID=A0A6A5QD89_AMPQU|nr:hypothetical protein BDU57DRAFT_457263 [Ampelomyces quisqualis]
MPSLPDFSNNPFRTRSDLIRAAQSLLQPLSQYKSNGNARIRIATSTGAGFSENAAQLEGFARPLWVVADLLRLEEQDSGSKQHSKDVGLESWISGLKAGTDPKSPEYWGAVASFDQRMVEMESIAYALLLHPKRFDCANDEHTRNNLISWLQQINQNKMPKTNWLWFRVLVNLALVKTLNVALVEVKAYIDDSLTTLDTFYISEGWSSDGLWCDERKQADYYSGSFAIQFAQLLFLRFAPEYDIERTERYKEQARCFGQSYWRYFAPNGAAIPFGRSLTYRFAFAAFWAAAAAANVALPAPVNEIGTIKGLLMRHLRWWAERPHIFNVDGTPNIGYTYSNMYLAEDYNSPQSVYWCLKSFLVLGLEESHPFWMCQERDHPQKIEGAWHREVEIIWPPRHIMCNTSEHNFLLSSGQYTTKHFKAREAKYGKFAYSSCFGFSVPCGSFLEQLAPDSTLAVSFDDGEDDWKVRWDPYSVTQGELAFGQETVATLTSSWKPLKTQHLNIKTTLIPPVKIWPGWHLRIHHIEWRTSPSSDAELRIVEGGFAASAQSKQNQSLFEQQCGDFQSTNYANAELEGWWSDDEKSLVISESGASGVIDLSSQYCKGSLYNHRVMSASRVLRADPNTNIMYPRSLIPIVEHKIQSQGHDNVSVAIITGVFAVDGNSGRSIAEMQELWRNKPCREFLGSTYIQLCALL